MPDTSEFKLCLTNVADKQAARDLAQLLLQLKLVACVNITSDMTSFYIWQGKIVEDNEVMLLMKTHQSKIEQLRCLIKEKHSYDLPEFIVLDIQSGSSEYLDWIKTSLE